MDALTSGIEQEWAEIAKKLKGQIPLIEFETWIWPLEPELHGGNLRVRAPFGMFRIYVEGRYSPLIDSIAGKEISIVNVKAGLGRPDARPWRRWFVDDGKSHGSKRRDVTPLCLAEPLSVIEDVLPDRMVVGARLSSSYQASVAHIIATVASFSGFSVEELLSRDYIQGAALSRNIATYLCREYTDVLLIGLGTAFDGLGHSTIMRRVRSAEKCMEKDPACQEKVNEILKLLGSPKKVVRKSYRIA